MDILIVYWNSVWRQSLRERSDLNRGASPEEWAAFYRRINQPDGNALKPA